MITVRAANPGFREGDEVVLAEGAYKGTLGTFIRLREDANWADVAEHNDGRIHSHPVAWLAHSTVATPGFRELNPGEPHTMREFPTEAGCKSR